MIKEDVNITQDMKIFQGIVKTAMENVGSSGGISIINIGQMQFVSNKKPELLPEEIDIKYIENKNDNNIIDIEKVYRLLPSPKILFMECFLTYFALKGNNFIMGKAAEELGRSYAWIKDRQGTPEYHQIVNIIEGEVK